MTSVRFLASVLLIGSLPALAQIQQKTISPAVPVFNVLADAATQLSTPEGWRIPERLPAANSTQNADTTTVSSISRTEPFDFNSDRGIVIPIDGQDSQDVFCLKMRTYVVARDSKDSDSVHPARYTTCQRASRYQLKTTQAQPASLDR